MRLFSQLSQLLWGRTNTLFIVVNNSHVFPEESYKNTFPGRRFLSSDRIWVACLICFLVKWQILLSSPFSLPEIQRFKQIIYIQRDDPSSSALQVMGIIQCSATCVVGLFHHKTCEQHFSCFQAGRHYSHFHQHSCSGNVPSGSLISGLILLRAPCFATDLRGCQRQSPHISGLLLVIVEWH